MAKLQKFIMWEVGKWYSLMGNAHHALNYNLMRPNKAKKCCHACHAVTLLLAERISNASRTLLEGKEKGIQLFGYSDFYLHATLETISVDYVVGKLKGGENLRVSWRTNFGQLRRG